MVRARLLRLFRPSRKPPASRRGFWRACGGNVAVVIGLSVPALATVVFGATDIASIMADRDRMHGIADAAALSGARSLSVAMQGSSAAESAKAMAQAMIAEWPGAPSITIGVDISMLKLGGKGVRVELDARRPSLFGDLLPPGGWQYAVVSTAASVGAKPLCVLAFGSGLKDVLVVGGSAEIRAPECLVHSNSDLAVTGGHVEVGQAEAVGSAAGDITPDPISDAPVIDDPFATRKIPTVTGCIGMSLKTLVTSYTTGTHTLAAGAHCGFVDVSGDANLVLAPGEHHFQLGMITVRGNAKLTGADVTLIFDATSYFNLTEKSVVNLTGRESGPYAGFVVIASRSNVREFAIDSTHVERLDGVIYIPNAVLKVSGTSDVARQSDWTVVVAQRLSLSGNPHLYLNTDYAGSPIGVPSGVGPRPGGARLIE